VGFWAPKRALRGKLGVNLPHLPLHPNTPQVYHDESVEGKTGYELFLGIRGQNKPHMFGTLGLNWR
jgi:hypothetical protein